MIGRRAKKCFFCESKTNPDFREIEMLRRFLSPRARIIIRMKSGVCAKHQKRLAQEIKKARHLAFLPFVS